MSKPTALTADLADLAAVAAYAPSLAQAFASLACDLALVLDGQGTITRVAHGPASTLMQATADWVGRPMVDTVTPDTRHKIDSLLAEAASLGLARRREVNLPSPSTPQGPTIPLAYTALRLGPDGPMLAVGHDLRAVALIQQRFMRVQQELERGYGLAQQASSGAGGRAAAPSALSAFSARAPAEVSEQLNEASRAAFAAWLRAERLAGDGPMPGAAASGLSGVGATAPQPPPAPAPPSGHTPRKPRAQRKR